MTGPGYDPDHVQTIRKGRIPVSAVTWKAIYDQTANGTGTYACLNTHHPTCKMTSVSLLIQLVNIYPFPALPASLKDHVSAMPPIRETPEALSKQPQGRELFWEWGLKAAQKALKVLVKALVQ